MVRTKTQNKDKSKSARKTRRPASLAGQNTQDAAGALCDMVCVCVCARARARARVYGGRQGARARTGVRVCVCMRACACA